MSETLYPNGGVTYRLNSDDAPSLAYKREPIPEGERLSDEAQSFKFRMDMARMEGEWRGAMWKHGLNPDALK